MKQNKTRSFLVLFFLLILVQVGKGQNVVASQGKPTNQNGALIQPTAINAEIAAAEKRAAANQGDVNKGTGVIVKPASNQIESKLLNQPSIVAASAKAEENKPQPKN